MIETFERKLNQIWPGCYLSSWYASEYAETQAIVIPIRIFGLIPWGETIAISRWHGGWTVWDEEIGRQLESLGETVYLD